MKALNVDVLKETYIDEGIIIQDSIKKERGAH